MCLLPERPFKAKPFSSRKSRHPRHPSRRTPTRLSTLVQRGDPITALGRWLLVFFIVALPAAAQQPSGPPPGATAQCRDGSYSFSKNRSGTCSHHGGLARWLANAATPTAPRPVDTLDGPPFAAHITCGIERWSVKVLGDPDRGRVRMQPVETTIDELAAMQRPALLPTDARADPVELTVYRVEARLLWLFAESDGDYHLVLASPRDTTITMIAEVPDPACASADSSDSQIYQRVRQRLMDTLNAPGGDRRPRIRVTGVGFFDYLHGQRGVAPNEIELHPVLSVEFP